MSKRGSKMTSKMTYFEHILDPQNDPPEGYIHGWPNIVTHIGMDIRYMDIPLWGCPKVVKKWCFGVSGTMYKVPNDRQI